MAYRLNSLAKVTQRVGGKSLEPHNSQVPSYFTLQGVVGNIIQSSLLIGDGPAESSLQILAKYYSLDKYILSVP